MLLPPLGLPAGTGLGDRVIAWIVQRTAVEGDVVTDDRYVADPDVTAGDRLNARPGRRVGCFIQRNLERNLVLMFGADQRLGARQIRRRDRIALDVDARLVGDVRGQLLRRQTLARVADRDRAAAAVLG